MEQGIRAAVYHLLTNFNVIIRASLDTLKSVCMGKGENPIEEIHPNSFDQNVMKKSWGGHVPVFAVLMV